MDRAEARDQFDAMVLPPVAQGDVLRAANERPFAIGIVDGYFEGLPAVWHKEVLWALSRGIHVFGAASMGALRAAELERFGMKGVGKIFAGFASGALEDDDEVAVAHGESLTDYQPTSEAMVNMRATLQAAEHAGVIAGRTRETLTSMAKSWFYPDRSFPRLFAHAIQQGTPASEVNALRSFVSTSRVDQKREDARTMLRAMRECCIAGTPPAPPSFSFAHTEAWDDVVEWAEAQPSLDKPGQAVPLDLVAAEARLLGEAGHQLFAAALGRVAAGALARRLHIPDRVARTEKLDRRVRQLCDAGPAARHPDDRIERWRSERGLDNRAYDALLDRGAELEWLQERYRFELERHVVDEVRWRDDYARLARRARRKQEVLAALDLEDPSLADGNVDEQTLFAWYFGEIARRPEGAADIVSYLRQVGLADRRALEREALREWLFRRHAQQEGS